MSAIRPSRAAAVLLLVVVLLSLSVAGCVSSPGPAATAHPAPGPTAAPAPAAGSLEAHFIDVGQGDAILVKCGNRTMLVDGGPTVAGPRVSSYLRGHGVTAIDVLVSTHPHEDHIGGLLTVLNDFPVGVVYDSGQPHTTQTYERYLTLIDQKNIRFKVPERGDKIDLGPGVSILVLSPPPGGLDGGDLNDNSIVLRIVCGDTAFLLAGDAGFRAESRMLASGYDLKSDVLKVGHHGSRYSSGAAFLDAVDPGISVIEVGSGNPYGHPSPATLARLEAIGSRVYRTDRDGDVLVVSDGKGLTVTTERAAPA